MDGGNALDKTIGNKNEERVDNVLDNIRGGGDVLLKLSMKLCTKYGI